MTVLGGIPPESTFVELVAPRQAHPRRDKNYRRASKPEAGEDRQQPLLDTPQNG